MSANLLSELGYEDPVAIGAVQGEIAEFTTDHVVVAGMFTPGDALDLRPGRRCVVLTEDAVASFDISAIGCPSCDDLTEERDNAQDRADVAEHELRDAEREIEKLRAQVLDLEGQLVDAREQLDGMLKHQT